MPDHTPLGPRITDVQKQAATTDVEAFFDNLDWRSGDILTIVIAEFEAVIQQKGHSLACVRQLFGHYLTEGVFTRAEQYLKGTTLCWGGFGQEVTPGVTVPVFKVAHADWYRYLAESQRASESGDIPMPPTGEVTQKRTRNRRKRIPELLLALLEDDHTHMGKSQTKLADILQCNPSSISRAFSDEEYGPRLLALYEEYRLEPPTADQI
jgi:hypothetical protein